MPAPKWYSFYGCTLQGTNIIPPLEKENHLQKCFGEENAGSQEGIAKNAKHHINYTDITWYNYLTIISYHWIFLPQPIRPFFVGVSIFWGFWRLGGNLVSKSFRLPIHWKMQHLPILLMVQKSCVHQLRLVAYRVSQGFIDTRLCRNSSMYHLTNFCMKILTWKPECCSGNLEGKPLRYLSKFLPSSCWWFRNPAQFFLQISQYS